MADPEVLTHSIRACATTGTAPPTRGRATRVRLVRHHGADVAGTSQAAAPAINAPSADRQQAIHILRDVSLHLLRGTAPAPSDETEDTFRAAELALVELGTRMCGLVGVEGYRALVARAVHLAACEFPLLRSVKPAIAPPGRLLGLPGPDSRHATASEARDAAVAILGELLWLLDEFIGRDLTQRVVMLVWPWLGETDTSRYAEPHRLSG